MFAFEKALICHCSPTLSGLKPANLLSLSKADYPDLPMLIESYSDILAPKGVSLDIVCECGHRWLLLVYRPAMLAKQLQNPAVHSLLTEEGYPLEGRFYLNEMIAHLRKRLLSSDGFPHEIGIFLGYPLEDVIDFRRYKGEGCKLCGYWKVYHDVESAKRCFAMFDRCRAILFSNFMAGTPFPQLVCNVPQAA